jgi:hypothetical protein
MKFRFALLAMLVGVAAPLAAQGGGGGGGRRGGGAMNIDQLTTQYALSSDQKTKTEALLKIYNDGTTATQAWMRSEAQAGAARNADSTKKVAEALAKFNADFKALLAGPQIAKFDSIQTARASSRRGGGGQ